MNHQLLNPQRGGWYRCLPVPEPRFLRGGGAADVGGEPSLLSAGGASEKKKTLGEVQTTRRPTSERVSNLRETSHSNNGWLGGGVAGG